MSVKVKVVSAIPGSGKTTACVNMINNAEPDKRFVFVTPYITDDNDRDKNGVPIKKSKEEEVRDESEVNRIKRLCHTKNFEDPDKLYNSDVGLASKLNGLHSLLSKKSNIVTTHALFARTTEETRKLIEEGSYTLVLDETMSCLRNVEGAKAADVEMMLRKGIISKDEPTDKVVWNDDEYVNGTFDNIRTLAKSGNLYILGDSFYEYIIQPEIFNGFREIYLLTYMFEHQTMASFFQIHNIEYELMGVKRINGVSVFCSIGECREKRDLTDKIDIFENKKLNHIGDSFNALSSTGLDKDKATQDKALLGKIKNNIRNYFLNYNNEYKPNERMWCCVDRFKKSLIGKGYVNSFVPFTQRATNRYVGRKNICYAVNVFINPVVRQHLVKLGAKPINETMYACQLMLQFIYRSCLRQNERIKIYIPSRRMRIILKEWIKNLANGEGEKIISLEGKIKRQRRG